MPENQSVFGGSGTGGPNTTPQSGLDLGSALNNAAVRTYVIQPDGANISMRFLANGMVDIDNNGQKFQLPYLRK